MEGISFGQYALPMILMVGLAFFYKIFDKADGTSYIPNRVKPLIAIGLGILLGIVAMFYNDIAPIFKNIVDYVLYGFMAGAGAVGLWEGFSAVKSGGNGAAKKIIIIFLLSVSCLSLSSCAFLQSQPTKTFDQLTPDERGRVVVSSFQNGTPILFQAGKTFIAVQPQYATEYKFGVVPGFDQLNKFLLDIETRGKAGQIIDQVTFLNAMQGRVMDITSIFTKWGTTVVIPGSKPTPEQYGLLAIIGLGTLSIAWNDILQMMGGTIPTWDEIILRNTQFQAQIEAEK